MSAGALKTLLQAAPFTGVDLTTEPFYIKPGMGAAASNVDISARLESFTTASGRSAAFSFIIPTGYTLVGLAPLTTFYNTVPIISRTIYVYCATNAQGPVSVGPPRHILIAQRGPPLPGAGTLFEVGTYDPTTLVKTVFPNALPFTSAVQFGSYLWTDGGDKWLFGDNLYGTPGTLSRDLWQIQMPSTAPYALKGTYRLGVPSLPQDTYTYAITLRRAESWKVGLNLGGYGTKFIRPDIDSLQESSPVFTTSVTIPAGSVPGFNTINGSPAAYLASLQTGTTAGGQTYYGCLYRSRVGQPTYQFVDYLVNIQIFTDYLGNPAFIDTAPDNLSAANLIIHNDPPPILGQVYPGFTPSNSSAITVAQNTTQVSFDYTNPSFIAKHKSRLWVFTMYPRAPLGHAAASSTVSLDPQLWYSDYNIPWSFNDDAGVLSIGPGDAPGNENYPLTNTLLPPWGPGITPDSPAGLAVVGSTLVAFKSQTTWLVYGDSPSEFLVRRGFDIGCLAPRSITVAEGGVFWLAPQGVYFFDGSSPSYVGEDIRAALDSLPYALLQSASGGYRNRTFYLSVNLVTYCYYTPTRKWYTLPYSADIMFSAQGQVQPLIFANTVGTVTGTMANVYNAAGSTGLDLGLPITSVWSSQISDSGSPGSVKSYRFVQIVAPQQYGLVTATLVVDPNFGTPSTFTWTWDLSKGNGAFVASIPATLAGYEAQLTLTAVTVMNPVTLYTLPITIRSAVVLGDVQSSVVPTTIEDHSGALNRTLTT